MCIAGCIRIAGCIQVAARLGGVIAILTSDASWEVDRVAERVLGGLLGIMLLGCRVRGALVARDRSPTQGSRREPSGPSRPSSGFTLPEPPKV